MKLANRREGRPARGRDIEYVQLDDESEPSKAPAERNRLVVGDKGGFPGPARCIRRGHGDGEGGARGERHAGHPQRRRRRGDRASFCAPNIFRTSFSNWQPAFPMARWRRRKATRPPRDGVKYGAARKSVAGFTEGFTKAGGKVVKESGCRSRRRVPGAADRAGGAQARLSLRVLRRRRGAKFVKDYDAAGLRKTVALYSTGFLTDGVLQAQGAAAEGLLTTLHYAENLDNPPTSASARPSKSRPTARRRLCRARLRHRAAADPGDGHVKGDLRRATR